MFNETSEPLDVVLLLIDEFSLMSLAATLDPLRAANRLTDGARYRWRVVSLDGHNPVSSGGLSFEVDGALDVDARPDALIVVAAFNAVARCDSRLLQAVSRASRAANHVIGVEAGAWVLGHAGLLRGCRATTHWEDLEDFAAQFPETETVADRWVADGRICTMGGAAPALDFMLSLIRARQGHSLSLEVASLYIYDGMRTASDEQPVVSLGRIAWREPRVMEAIRLMEAHIDTPITVAEIGRAVGVSAKTLETLFAGVVGMTPGAFYLDLRLKTARRLIIDTGLSVTETAVRTGFSSAGALSRSFARRFGMSPRAARRASL